MKILDRFPFILTSVMQANHKTVSLSDCLSVLALGHFSLPKLALICPSKSVQWHNSANSSLCYGTTHRMLHATNHKYFDLLVVLIY